MKKTGHNLRLCVSLFVKNDRRLYLYLLLFSLYLCVYAVSRILYFRHLDISRIKMSVSVSKSVLHNNLIHNFCWNLYKTTLNWKVDTAKWEYWKEKVDNCVRLSCFTTKKCVILCQNLATECELYLKKSLSKVLLRDINAVIGIEKIGMRRFIVYI